MTEFISDAYPLPDGYDDFTVHGNNFNGTVFLIPDPDAPFGDMLQVVYPRDFFDTYKDAMDGREQYSTQEEYNSHFRALEQYNTRLVAWLESLGFDVRGPDAYGWEIQHYAALGRKALRAYRARNPL